MRFWLFLPKTWKCMCSSIQVNSLCGLMKMKLSAQLLRRNPTGSQKPKTVSCTHNRKNRETEQLPQPATEQHRRVGHRLRDRKTNGTRRKDHMTNNAITATAIARIPCDCEPFVPAPPSFDSDSRGLCGLPQYCQQKRIPR